MRAYTNDHYSVLHALYKPDSALTAGEIAGIGSEQWIPRNGGVPVERFIRNALRRPRSDGLIEQSEKRGAWQLTREGAHFVKIHTRNDEPIYDGVELASMLDEAREAAKDSRAKERAPEERAA